MWTNKNRARYDRSKLRYPSDLTDDEWGLVEPLIPPGKTERNPGHLMVYKRVMCKHGRDEGVTGVTSSSSHCFSAKKS